MPNIFSRVATTVNRLLDIVSTGNLERMRLLRELNHAYREGYLSGELNYLCHVTTTIGDSRYRHELSHFMRTGIKITIVNSHGLQKREVIEYGNCLVAEIRFVRILMSLGYDTLILKPQVPSTQFQQLQIGLRRFSGLSNYMID